TSTSNPPPATPSSSTSSGAPEPAREAGWPPSALGGALGAVGRPLGLHRLLVLLQRPAVAVGPRADDAAVAHLLHHLLQVEEAVVDVVLGSGGDHPVEGGVDLVELPPHLPVLVHQLLVQLFDALGHGGTLLRVGRLEAV